MRWSPTRIASLAVVLCLLSFAAHAGENTWTVSGPPGGMFRDLESSPTDDNVFYAAYGRSFFRTTDGATNWQSYEFVHEVVDIAVDPTDGTRVYVAALEDGLYRSEDGGRTFMKIAPGDTFVWSVGVGGADGKTVYYSTANGSFFQSTDRGQSFTARPLTQITITQIRIEGADGLTVLAARGPTFLKSPDGGATWSEATVHGTDSITSFTRLGNGTLVATTAGQGGVSTSPDGTTWTQTLPGTFYAATADPANPATVIAANVVGLVPGRVLWQNPASGTAPNWNTFGTAYPVGTPLGGPRKIVITPGSPNRLVAANAQGVQISPDRGSTWHEASSGLNASAPARLATTAGTDAPVYAYTSGDTSGLFATRTDDGWERLNLPAAQFLQPSKPFGQATLAVKPGEPSTLFVGAFDAGLFRSNDGGDTWSGPAVGLTGFGLNAFAFDPADANVMYANVSQGSQTPTARLYRSIDGGASWTPRSLDLPNLFGLRLVVNPSDANRLLLAATDPGTPPSGLWQSVDAGLHWTIVAFVDHTVRDVAFDPSDTNRIYAAVDNGLWVSTDGGFGFEPNAALRALTAQVVTAVAIDPVIPTTLYAATADANATSNPQSSLVLRSVDRGQSWEQLRGATDQPIWFASDLLLDPNVPTLLYVGTGGRGIGTFEIVNDLAVSISGHSGVKPKGLPSAFDVNVQNSGSLSATGVHLTVQLPAGLTSVSTTPTAGTCSLANDTVQCDVPVVRSAQTASVHVAYTPPGEMALPVDATVTAHERDNTAANNSAQASAVAGEVVDLRVTITPSASSVVVGNGVTYTVQVNNAGPLASSSATLTFTLAAGVSFGSPLPAGCTASGVTATCTLGALAVGASQSFALPATANTAGSNVANASIAVAPNAADADASNNAAQSTVTITAAPPPSTGGGKKGGGGSLDDLILLALSIALLFASRRRLQCRGRASSSSGTRPAGRSSLIRAATSGSR